ncbi:LysM peptidoglycan-binding domain-containing protein, partial [Carnobacterium maltaromaticum]|uniref:LysM peptidoglycan-binding domain-containing protein n=1 Tax=Carnobacterium maltaromaticum TaxID=2751 RepID=UPI000A5143BA
LINSIPLKILSTLLVYIQTPPTEFMETKPAIHIVDEGETLYSIATKHGITVGLLKELNFNDTNPSVYVGQQLKLMG